jgi:tetratricopeptide (TPR) repeat protein
VVRALAREEWSRLPTTEQEAALRALLAGVCDWLAEHQTQDPDVYALLSPDEDLIAGALRTAAARQVDLPQVIRIVDAWRGYLFRGNLRLDVAMRTLQLESAHTLGDDPAELAALNALIQACGFSGREDEAARHRREALTLARKMGEQVVVLRMLGAISEETAIHGAQADATLRYAEAEHIAATLGARLIDFDALNNLGNAARALDRLTAAKRWYRRALASARGAHNLPNEALAKSNLCFIYAWEGKTAAVQRYCDEVMPVFQVAGYTFGLGGLYNVLGQCALRALLGQCVPEASDLATASDYLNKALAHFEQTDAAGMTRHVHANQTILTGLHALHGRDRGTAARAFEEALSQLEQIGRMPDVLELRPFLHQRLTELREPSAASMPNSSSKPS